MEDKIAFENFLYEDSKEVVLSDMEFCADRIVMLPVFRPHRLEHAVNLSVYYCQSSDFRQKIIKRIKICPVLIYQLYKRGIFEYGEIDPFMRKETALNELFYFRKEIKNFENVIKKKGIEYGYDNSYFVNENDIDQLIEYGFLPSSIEYCLKYDFVDGLKNFDNLNHTAKWSLFEWSYRPQYTDLLSFSGFFGSIKCFKYLLVNGIDITGKVISMVYCSGCIELFHLCKGIQFLTLDNACSLSTFCHLPLLVFMIENGFDINASDIDDGFFFLNIHFFIMLH